MTKDNSIYKNELKKKFFSFKTLFSNKSSLNNF